MGCWLLVARRSYGVYYKFFFLLFMTFAFNEEFLEYLYSIKVVCLLLWKEEEFLTRISLRITNFMRLLGEGVQWMERGSHHQLISVFVCFLYFIARSLNDSRGIFKSFKTPWISNAALHLAILLLCNLNVTVFLS